tara:strand:+ start:525 stop:650 length:126 start_codon:yes stop_codon:yes gene_type:complete
MEDYPLFWIFLEIFLGLGMFLLIIFWTLPKKIDKQRESDDK